MRSIFIFLAIWLVSTLGWAQSPQPPVTVPGMELLAKAPALHTAVLQRPGAIRHLHKTRGRRHAYKPKSFAAKLRTVRTVGAPFSAQMPRVNAIRAFPVAAKHRSAPKRHVEVKRVLSAAKPRLKAGAMSVREPVGQYQSHAYPRHPVRKASANPRKASRQKVRQVSLPAPKALREREHALDLAHRPGLSAVGAPSTSKPRVRLPTATPAPSLGEPPGGQFREPGGAAVTLTAAPPESPTPAVEVDPVYEAVPLPANMTPGQYLDQLKAQLVEARSAVATKNTHNRLAAEAFLASMQANAHDPPPLQFLNPGGSSPGLATLVTNIANNLFSRGGKSLSLPLQYDRLSSTWLVLARGPTGATSVGVVLRASL